MLQLVGLLLCLMLFVKGVEFLHRTQVAPREDGAGRVLGALMFILCTVGAILFAMAFIAAPMR